MAQICNTYIFDNEYETILHFNNPTPEWPQVPITDPQNIPRVPHWRPSPKFKRLYDRFQDNILSQWPRIACVYCGKLLYPEKANWTLYDSLTTYPLQQRVPNVSLSFHPNISRITQLRVPICESCKRPSTRYSFPHLSPMPEEITSVPPHKRKHLSAVYLH